MFNPMLPAWLAGLTGADKFGTAAGANLGDMFQAAGHSMAQHYRGKGGTFGAGQPGEAGAATLAPFPPQMTDAPSAIAALGSQPPITGGPLPPAADPRAVPQPLAASRNGGAMPQPAQPWGQITNLPLGLLLGNLGRNF
jgi:hypothetical protein